ncbi:mechanosensitive ion channel family protein [Candidatus Fermentibacterales bacterium]|nr:mechanosensitive ion channel family protein [Candidatus Fermentibacterales bacterium]
MVIPEGLQTVIGFRLLGVPIGRLAAAAAILLVSILIRKMLLGFIRSKLERGDRAGADREEAGEQQQIPKRRLAATYLRAGFRRSLRPIGLAVLVLGLYLALEMLGLPDSLQIWTGRAFLLLIVIDVTWFLFGLIDGAADAMGALADRTESQLDDQLVPLLRKVAKGVVAALAIVFALQAMGYPVGGLLAGLGIGGIALALAAQDTVAGVFASVAIFLDRPFMVGDFIKVGDQIGTVEEIGIRSTRLRTVEKTLVSIPNKILMDERIDNWSMRPMRRVDMKIGVTYSTTPDQMEGLLSDVRTYLASNRDVDDEMILVNFTEFSDSSLDIEMRFFVRTVDYAEWLDMRERINLDVMRMVASRGLSMAFPSTSIYMEKG